MYDIESVKSSGDQFIQADLFAEKVLNQKVLICMELLDEIKAYLIRKGAKRTTIRETRVDNIISCLQNPHKNEFIAFQLQVDRLSETEICVVKLPFGRELRWEFVVEDTSKYYCGYEKLQLSKIMSYQKLTELSLNEDNNPAIRIDMGDNFGKRCEFSFKDINLNVFDP